jgi:hypothetical protein
MPYANIESLVGNQPIATFGLPDAVSRQQPGMLITAADPYWGTGEFVYVRASAAIRSLGLVTLTQALIGGVWVWNAAEVTNVANLGKMVGVAMTSAAIGNFLWVCISGIIPVNCQAAIAADAAWGVAAVGQGGAITAGKQILNSRIVAPSTTAIAKPNCLANNASNQLTVTNTEGWFIGAFLSGAGIPAGCTVVEISSDGRTVILSANTNAFVNGVVTATYNNGVIFYNVAHLNRPFQQGQIL